MESEPESQSEISELLDCDSDFTPQDCDTDYTSENDDLAPDENELQPERTAKNFQQYLVFESELNKLLHHMLRSIRIRLYIF